MERVAVYLRISEDKDGSQTATDRQLEDCTKYAHARGFNITQVYEDIDLSAYKRDVRRPQFERMLEAVRDREVDGVIAWKLDRISRRQRDFVRLYEECEGAGAFICTASDGIDTRSSTGRLIGEILTSVAHQESQNMSLRITRAHEAMAKAGKPSAGGTRPFGYTADRQRVRPEEAELIREAAKRILAGEGLRGVCLDWERRGVVSPAGKPWKQGPLRRLLTNPLLSAQRIYKGATIEGKWPAILKPEQTARLRLLLLDPARRKSMGNSRSYLLSGFLRCGRCGSNLVARPRQDKVRRYVCPRMPGRPNCGRLARVAAPVEEVVTEALFVALEDADLSAYVKRSQTHDMRLLEDAIRADENALEQLAQDHYASRIIERAEFLSARATIQERLSHNRSRASEDRQHGVLGALMAGAKLRETWPERPLDWKRAVLSVIVDHVVLKPAVKGNNKFDPSLVAPIWKV